MSHRLKVFVSVLPSIFRTDGTTVRARRVIAVLKKYYKVLVVTRGNKNQEIDHENLLDLKLKIVTSERTKLWNLKLIPIIFRSNFDCVYCANDWYGFLTYWLFRRLRKYKIIFEAHSILSKEYEESNSNWIKAKFFQTLEKFSIAHADSVIALSGDTLRFYKRFNEKIDLVPVFLDEDKYQANRRMANRTKEGHKLIGLIGPFDTVFNRCFLDFLYQNVEEFDTRIRFVVIGECPNRIEHERISYTGYLNSTDYISQLYCLDAVLVPSRVATFSPLNKILEPMLCGLPVFTTPAGIVGLDYVKAGRDILVFDEAALASRIGELILNEKLMVEIGNNARKIAEQYYSQRTNEKKIAVAIRKLGFPFNEL